MLYTMKQQKLSTVIKKAIGKDGFFLNRIQKLFIPKNINPSVFLSSQFS